MTNLFYGTEIGESLECLTKHMSEVDKDNFDNFLFSTEHDELREISPEFMENITTDNPKYWRPL